MWTGRHVEGMWTGRAALVIFARAGQCAPQAALRHSDGSAPGHGPQMKRRTSPATCGSCSSVLLGGWCISSRPMLSHRGGESGGSGWSAWPPCQGTRLTRRRNAWSAKETRENFGFIRSGGTFAQSAARGPRTQGSRGCRCTCHVTGRCMARGDRACPPPPGGGCHRFDADCATGRAAHRKSQTAPLQGEGAARGRWTTPVLPEAQADSPRWYASILSANICTVSPANRRSRRAR